MAAEIDPRLLKIAALAREGVGGEKDAAMRILAAHAAKMGTTVDQILNATDEAEYSIPYKNKEQREILAQVLHKFATTESHPDVMQTVRPPALYFWATPSQYVEAIYACGVYWEAYVKERAAIIKAIPGGFVVKHSLWSDRPAPDRDRPELTESQREKLRRQVALSDQMSDVHVRRALEAGND